MTIAGGAAEADEAAGPAAEEDEGEDEAGALEDEAGPPTTDEAAALEGETLAELAIADEGLTGAAED